MRQHLVPGVRVVIPSVNYGDLLAVTLPAWLAYFEASDIIVVTSPNDIETAQVASEHAVKLLTTDAWLRNGAKFNKAAALDEAFEFPARRVEDCYSIDADIFPEGIMPDRLEPGIIYGAQRFDVHSNTELAARVTTRQYQPKWYAAQHTLHREVCLGCVQFFQSFKGLRFGSYPTAARYDIDFAIRNFKRGEILPGFRAFHLGEGHKNWSGRVAQKWR